MNRILIDALIKIIALALEGEKDLNEGKTYFPYWKIRKVAEKAIEDYTNREEAV